MRIHQAIQATTALAAGIFITFSQVHDSSTALIGLLVLCAGWLAASVTTAIKNFGEPGTSVHIVVAGGTILMAILAILTANSPIYFGTWLLLAHWGFYGAVIEAIFAKQAPAKTPARRDHLISMALGLGLYLSQAIIMIAGNDPVSQVGFFGAYAVIIGVHLGIAAASPAVAK